MTNFYRSEVFDENFFPDEVLCREEEMKHLADLISSKKNVILNGPPSSGKSFLVKRLQRILNTSDNHKAVYVDCKENRDRSSVMGSILSELPHEGNEDIIDRFDVQFDAIENIIEELEYDFVSICLDNYDKLIETYEDQSENILYLFGNSGDFHVIVIDMTNEQYHEYHGPPTRGRFSPQTIYLGRYSEEQILEILQQRLELALPQNPNFITNKELTRLSILCAANGGDLRAAILTLQHLIEFRHFKFSTPFRAFDIQSLLNEYLE